MGAGPRRGIELDEEIIGVESTASQAPITDGMFYMPDSPHIHATMKVLGAQGDLLAMAARYNRHPTAHDARIEYGEEGDTRIVQFTRGDDVYRFEINDKKVLAGYNKGIKKIYSYALAKINQQAHSNGTLRRNFVSFPLQELLDVGIYKNIRAARVGFTKAEEPLTSIKIGGTVSKARGKEKKKLTTSASGVAVMFNAAFIKNGDCFIYMNELIDWSLITLFYTVMPVFYFSLPAKADDLLHYIFSLARQNINKLSTRGYFDIKNRSIAIYLGLPDETEVKNPTDAIKNKIEEAVEGIEKKMEASPDKGALKITSYPAEAGRRSISDYLDNGYKRIELSGNYLSYFTALGANRTKKIEAAKRAKERKEIAIEAKIRTRKKKKE